MKSSYVSYVEGYDTTGQLIYNGNGAITVEHNPGECIDPTDITDKHCAYFLEKAQESNSLITRIVIKNLMKL